MSAPPDRDEPCSTYAIGDVHGRFDLLVEALTWIIGDLDHPGRREVILLGDYVDRGPSSRECVELLMDLTARGWVRCLKGNHEKMAVQAFHGIAEDRWLRLGGRQTLQSYGVETAAALPPEHIAWMEALPLTFSDPHRDFVHAGLAPGQPMEAQAEDWLLWIREPFLSAPADRFPPDRHIVHGHTPHWALKNPNEPELLEHRTNLDTGAFATGVLTIGVFDSRSPGGPSTVKPITPKQHSTFGEFLPNRQIDIVADWLS